MRRLSLSIAATLLLLAAPLSTAAQQYATPEEILLSGKRGAQQAVQEDTKRRLNLHPSTLSEPGTGPAAGALQAAPSEEEPDLHAAPSKEPGTSDGEPALDPVTLRYLRRLQNLRQLQYQEILQSTSLHQGASLSDTGPAAILALLAVLGAVGVTIWRARKMGF